MATGVLVVVLLLVAGGSAGASKPPSPPCSRSCATVNCDCLMSIKCHEKFKNCMRKVKKTGKVGFSKKCPYELAMATMTQGMDMAIMLSQLGSHKLEL